MNAQQCWSIIRNWYKKHAIFMLDSLLPGVNPKNIEAFEHLVGSIMPDDFKESYQYCGGQAQFSIPLFEYWHLLSLEKIQEEWDRMKLFFGNKALDIDWVVETADLIDPRIDMASWKPEWIPFASNPMGTLLCLDLAPSSTGSRGQVIQFRYDNMQRKFIHNSFGNWLEEFAQGLLADKYVFLDNSIQKSI